MRSELKPNLKKKLKKISRKDVQTYYAILKKIQKIINSDVSHYKNLRKPLQEFKRVHVRGPFVLVFKYIDPEDKVIFYDFDHHDNIYKD